MKSERESLLSLRETERAICQIKEYFPSQLAQELHLFQVSAPLFVRTGTGINDDLNGVEKPVAFTIKADGAQAEIVHSLAKWKRMALSKYGCARGEGIYTDMRAIRADEECDATHSLYVDQWDWEQAIEAQDRTIEYLQLVVKRIYKVLKATERLMHALHPVLMARLPEEIHFIHSEQLEGMFPDLSRRERENEICRRHGAVFLIGIGADLADNSRAHPRIESHTRISPFNPLNFCAVCVDKEALTRQLALRNVAARSSLLFHRMLLEDALPLSIGGGIGQSRVCMFLLQKDHICQVQESVWPSYNVCECAL
jgi:aspartate--ammonia ligase